MNSALAVSQSDLFSALAASAGGERALLRSIFDQLPYSMALFDRSLRVTFLSPALRKALEQDKDPEEKDALPGGTFDRLFAGVRFIDPNTLTPVPRERLAPPRALAGETVAAQELLMRRVKTGGALWVECAAWPLREPSGATCGVAMTMRDVTQAKKHELALDAAGQIRDFVYHGNLAGIIRSTVDGRILDCNDAAVRMFGFESKEEMLSTRSQQLYFDASERDRLLGLLERRNELHNIEICWRRTDGSKLWTIVNLRMLDAQPGDVGGSILSILLDITARRRQEDLIRQSEERFSAFMQHLPGVAFIKDLAGRYVYYNEVSERLFGRKPEEIVGKTDEEIWPAEVAAKYRENDRQVIETGAHSEFVEPVEHPDGRHTWLIYKFPIRQNDRVALVGGIGIDVTERELLAEQLNDSRKMEALGRLAGGVAHDFNNHLTVISGYGQMALEGVGNTPPDRMISYLQYILNSARRATDLTGQLLAFSRKQVIQQTVLDLGALLRNMHMLLQRVIGEHIDLTVRTGPARCAIRSDASRIEQVVMNLSVNARDAMPLGGSLHIECSRLESPVQRENGPDLRILLEVRDTGIGMEESVKAQIFEPFFTNKEKGRGTGLGLSTVYGIVSQAGGHIEVESQPGEGTVFRIYFPEAEGETEPAPLPPANFTGPEACATVLLVEDEPAVRSLAATILNRLGYRVLAAESGAAALELWRQRAAEVDVLLSDVIMPQMSGAELAQKLRALKPDLKVMFMSGYTDDMIARHGLSADGIPILTKPFTPESLASMLRETLQK